MKKIIPAIAILGSVAALVAYKIKKDEKKEIVDLDQGLLSDEDLYEGNDEHVEAGPISEPQSCCMNDVKECAKDIAEDVKDKAEDFCEKAQDEVKKTKKKVKKAVGEFDEKFPEILVEEVTSLKAKAEEIIQKMLEEGDVHANERPVRHSVIFETKEDFDAFKNTVINKGFVVSKGDADLELIVLHITPMEELKLIPNILYLVNEAHKNNGKYEGWTSKVTL
ncbi:MAG: ribonuclease E inhibitor RraB [Longicatena sp.]